MTLPHPHSPAQHPARHTVGGTRARGFTLIEILVALAVIAIALAAIVGETAQSLNNAARLIDHTLAHWVAMNRITEQQLSPSWPAVGITTGSAELADREWFWTLKVSSTEDADVRRLDIEVRAEKDAERPDSTAIAYLERPS
ncbi:MAG: type II secretion system minor pseudopilin GspI [Gammaproteobacteria bacterium]|nr:type II secretion system minor pseudopilin GspI [Gammaproteobacteria bacterium]